MKMMKNLKLKYILIPICVIVIAVIGICRSDIFTSKQDITISKNDNWIIKEVKVDITNIDESIAIVPKWDEMSISQQFSSVEYDNTRYSSRTTKITSDNILKNIGDSVLTGYDTYTKTTYNKKGYLYSIRNLSDKCAIAVKFEGENDYYVYVNAYYRPATLGEFINDLKLEQITSFGTVNYSYWAENSEGDMEYKNIEFYNVDNKMIWQKLFDNPNLENIYSDNDASKYTSERFSQSISISVDIPLLGYKNISVSLTDKGYLLTNILDTGKGFYIGEDKVQEFLDYIKENYDGYEIVYVEEKGNDIIDEESKIEDEKIIIVENETKESTVVDVDSTNENRIEANEN